MDLLHQELLIEIFQSLDVTDLISCSQVCTRWQSLIAQHSIRQLVFYVYRNPHLQQPAKICAGLASGDACNGRTIEKHLSTFDYKLWPTVFKDHAIFRQLTQLIIHSTDSLVTATSSFGGRLHLDQCPSLEHLEVHSVSIATRLNHEWIQNDVQLKKVKHLHMDQLDIWSTMKTFPNLLYVSGRQADISRKMDGRLPDQTKWTHFSLYETSILKDRIVYLLTMFCSNLQHMQVNLRLVAHVRHLIKTLPKLRHLSFNLQMIDGPNDDGALPFFFRDRVKILNDRPVQFRKTCLLKAMPGVQKNGKPFLPVQDDVGTLVVAANLQRRCQGDFSSCVPAPFHSKPVELFYNGIHVDQYVHPFFRQLERIQFRNLNFSEINVMKEREHFPQPYLNASAVWTRALHANFTTIAFLSEQRILGNFNHLRELTLVAPGFETPVQIESAFPLLLMELPGESLNVLTIRKASRVPQCLLNQLSVCFPQLVELELSSAQRRHKLCPRFLQAFPLLNRLELSAFELTEPNKLAELVDQCLPLCHLTLDEIIIPNVKALIESLSKKAKRYPDLEITLVYTEHIAKTEWDLLTEPTNLTVLCQNPCIVWPY